MSDTARGSRVGSQVGRFYLTRLLGHGGMGEVYEAQDTERQRVVAVKLLSPALSRDPAFRERLTWEVHTSGRLHDPHAVPIQDYGELDGQLFVDMPLIDGTDLSTMLGQLGTLAPARAVAIIRQVGLVLDAAHAVGVIHRDVKPENSLITGDDFAYLADFGIADAAFAGALKYSAPERFSDMPTNPGVDVYSLACVLYECLTGAPPYHGADARALISAHMTQPIPRPSQAHSGVPAAFDEVIARGMAKDPQLRYPSAGDLALAAYQALSWPDQAPEEETIARAQVGPSYPPAAEWPAVPPPLPGAHPGPGDYGGAVLPHAARRRRVPISPMRRTSSEWVA